MIPFFHTPGDTESIKTNKYQAIFHIDTLNWGQKGQKKAKNWELGIFSAILKHLNAIDKIIVWFVWIPGLLECGKMASHVEFR